MSEDEPWFDKGRLKGVPKSSRVMGGREGGKVAYKKNPKKDVKELDEVYQSEINANILISLNV